MNSCPNCGGENREQARFCGHCGKPLPTHHPKQEEQLTEEMKQKIEFELIRSKINQREFELNRSPYPLAEETIDCMAELELEMQQYNQQPIWSRVLKNTRDCPSESCRVLAFCVFLGVIAATSGSGLSVAALVGGTIFGVAACAGVLFIAEAW